MRCWVCGGRCFENPSIGLKQDYPVRQFLHDDEEMDDDHDASVSVD